MLQSIWHSNILQGVIIVRWRHVSCSCLQASLSQPEACQVKDLLSVFKGCSSFYRQPDCWNFHKLSKTALIWQCQPFRWLLCPSWVHSCTPLLTSHKHKLFLQLLALQCMRL